MRLATCALAIALSTACSASHDTEPGAVPLVDASIDEGTAPGFDVSPDACTTTVSGTVWNPAQTDPLYNVVVYVPSTDLEPFKPGVSCDKCGAVSGTPVTATLSGADGKFKLENVPAGTNVPLVVQVGKWRRRVVVPKVTACENNELPGELTRLPRNQREGDIPLTAIVTSTYDPTECVLRKIGIDESEFTLMLGGGRIHLFRGTGQNLGPDTPSGDVLYSRPDRLKNYDLVAFPCASFTIDSAYKQNVVDYANIGGRVFVTDMSSGWVDTSAPAEWSGVAEWKDGAPENPFRIATDFPKGKALADWLQAIGATPTYAQLDLSGAYARVSAVNAPARGWINNSTSIQQFSFNTPVGAKDDAQCGRVVYSSFHVALPGGNDKFPSGCSPKPLTPQEKVLEFILFDLASCIQIDTEVPKPPK